MSVAEIVETAVNNTFRSKLRTTLTVLAIFVGAFTLTLTNGLGTGISSYIDSQVSSLGASDTIIVRKASAGAGPGFGSGDSGPTEYDPDKEFVSTGVGLQREALSSADLEAVRGIPGVLSVEPIRPVAPDFISWNDGKKFELSVQPTTIGAGLDLLAGRAFDAERAGKEIILPYSYVEPLGFAGPQEAVGETVSIGVTDTLGRAHLVEAQIAAVRGDSIVGAGANISSALADSIFEAQTTGLPRASTEIYVATTARIAQNASAADVTRIKDKLSDAGYSAVTVEDQLGIVQSVITAIVGVLNAFAAIALFAAGFGIINTLLMSVQERTREIGLMKALGMGSSRVFALFSAEAVFIGFLGSAIGSFIAILVGTFISKVLANGILSDLTGLRILSFDPISVALVILLIMALAFVAGTLPAARAARQNPIDALRFE